MFRSAGNPVVSRPRTHGRHPSARVPCASSRRSSCAPRTGGSQQGRASAQGWSRLVHKTQQGAHFLEREPELPRPQHESKPPLMHRVIASVPVGCPRRRRQETDLFIIAHGFEVGARPPASSARRSTPSALTTPAASTPPAPTTSCGCNCAKWVVSGTGSRRYATGCKV
jgi:hypothetical protein